MNVAITFLKLGTAQDLIVKFNNRLGKFRLLSFYFVP